MGGTDAPHPINRRTPVNRDPRRPALATRPWPTPRPDSSRPRRKLDQARGITLWTGERFKLDSPRAFGDSVSGMQKDKSVRKLALADVKKFEMHTIHPERSTPCWSKRPCASIFSVIARGGTCESEDEEE